MLVRHDGTVVEGDRPLNQAAFAIHSQVHAARPDVISAAHSHSVYGKTWSSSPGCSIRSPRTRARSTTTMRCSTSTPASCSTSKRASASRTNWATARQSFYETTVYSPSATPSRRPRGSSSTMEQSCQAQLLAEAAGTPVLIEPMAKHTAGQVGTHFADWFTSSPCSRASPASSRTSSSEPACARTRPAARRRTGVGAANQRTPDRGRTPPPVGLDRRGTRLLRRRTHPRRDRTRPPGAPTCPQPRSRHRTPGLPARPKRRARTAGSGDRPRLPHVDVRRRVRHARRTDARHGALLRRLPPSRLWALASGRRRGLHAAQRRRLQRCADEPVWHRQPSTRRPMRSTVHAGRVPRSSGTALSVFMSRRVRCSI